MSAFGTSGGSYAGTYGIVYFDDCKWSRDLGQTKFVGYITNIYPASGQFSNPVTLVECHDWMGYAGKQQIGIQAVQSDKTADEALTTLLAEFPNQPEATDFDTGDQTFDSVFLGDSDTASMASQFQKLCRNEQGRIYLKGDGTLVFENASARAGITTSSFTLDGNTSDIKLAYNVSNLYNIVALTIKNRTTDAAATTELWTIGDEGIEIGAGEEITLICRFRDPDTGLLCAASDVVTPVAAPHFGSTQTPAADDSHADLNDHNYSVGGSALSVDLENTGAATGYVNEFTVLGKRVLEYDNMVITSEDQESIDQVGERRYTNRLDLIVDPKTAKDIADDIIEKYAPSHIDKCRIIVLANQTSTLANALVAAEVSTRFRLKEDLLGIDGDYFINHLSYKQQDTLLIVTIEAEEA